MRWQNHRNVRESQNCARLNATQVDHFVARLPSQGTDPILYCSAIDQLERHILERATRYISTGRRGHFGQPRERQRFVQQINSESCSGRTGIVSTRRLSLKRLPDGESRLTTRARLMQERMNEVERLSLRIATRHASPDV